MAKKRNFKVGDLVVYPAHGTGKIISEEKEKYVGIEIPVYVITFNSVDITLKIPKSKAETVGLRCLTSSKFLDKALDILSNKKIRSYTGMWNKRVQEYENKVNSGDIIAIAEVIKELHSDIEKAEGSYTEKTIYNDAVEKLAWEYAITHKVELDEAINKINTTLA